VKGLTWRIAADGTVRFRTERGELPTWLDPEQAEQLVSDLRQRQTWQPDPEYVPQPHTSDGGVITTMRSNL